MTTSRLRPYLALALGVFALGFSALFVRWANAPGTVTAMYRTGVASLVLTPFVWQRRHAPSSLSRPHLRYIVWGGVFTALDLALWNAGINRTAAGTATLLANTAPLWVALYASIFLREHLPPRFWVALVLTLSGSVIVLGTDFFHHPAFSIGDLLALGSGLFYAGYYLTTQRGRQHIDTLSYIWGMGLVSSASLLAISLALGFPILAYPPQSYLAFLGAALITQLGGYVSMGYALGHLPASVVAPTMIGQPVLTILLAIPLLGEMPHPLQWFGSAIVLTGIYLIHRSRMTAASKRR